MSIKDGGRGGPPSPIKSPCKILAVAERVAHLLTKYCACCDSPRTRLSVDKHTPVHRPAQVLGRIHSVARLGGLHHQYVRVAQLAAVGADRDMCSDLLQLALQSTDHNTCPARTMRTPGPNRVAAVPPWPGPPQRRQQHRMADPSARRCRTGNVRRRTGSTPTAKSSGRRFAETVRR